MSQRKEISYSGYLQLDKILQAQQPLSTAHDEMLFVIQHQTSELWMKLAIHELSATCRLIAADDLQPAFKTLSRVSRILEQLNSAWDVLRTMTPSEYTEFRGLLGQSSGFQSWQYRVIEFLVGNKNAAMIQTHRDDDAAVERLEAVRRAPSIYDLTIQLLHRRGLGIDDAILERDVSVPHEASDSVRNAWLAVYQDPTRFWELYELAEKLVSEGKQAKVIIASNVAAHVDRINDFLKAFKILLAPDGVISFEIAYAVDMIDKCEFDTIYHEHLFYHSLIGFKNLLERNGLYMNEATHLSIHGGSLRVYASHKPERTATLDAWLAREHNRGVDSVAFYNTFADQVKDNAENLRGLLKRLKRDGARIACWGAASKGSTMLNYLGLGPDFFEWVIDISEQKQGKFMPGERLLIVAPQKLIEERPEYTLILVWNFADDVIRSQSDYREHGGRFIMPVPPRIIH